MEKQDIIWGILSSKERMAQSSTACEKINSIIELGVKGYFPLFYQEWLGEYKKLQKTIRSNPQTRKFAQKTIGRLNKHRKLDRKRTVLSSLSKNQLMVFINEFMRIVERKILNSKPEIH